LNWPPNRLPNTRQPARTSPQNAFTEIVIHSTELWEVSLKRKKILL